MSLDPHRHHDTPSGPLTDEGSPEGARAANLLVGVMVALLLIALGVIVAVRVPSYGHPMGVTPAGAAP